MRLTAREKRYREKMAEAAEEAGSSSEEEVEDGFLAGDVLPLFSDALPFDCFVVEGDAATPRRALHVKSVKKGLDPRLFANRVWNGARNLAEFMCTRRTDFAGRTVVELGAASGLPSLVAAALGSTSVVMTDFPCPLLLRNMEELVRKNGFRLVEEAAAAGEGGAPVVAAVTSTPEGKAGERPQQRVHVAGHKWGDDAAGLLEKNGGEGFDVVLIAECFWADTYEQHANLLRSAKTLLAPQGEVLVSFCHHNTPPGSPFVHLIEHDMEFFAKAESDAFEMDVELVETRTMAEMCCVGDDADRADVFLYRLRHRGQGGGRGEEGVAALAGGNSATTTTCATTTDTSTTSTTGTT